MRILKKFLAAGVTTAMVLGAVGVMPEATAKAATTYDSAKHEVTVDVAAANGTAYVAVVKGGAKAPKAYDAFFSSATTYKINLNAFATTKDLDIYYSTSGGEVNATNKLTIKGFATKLKAKVVSGGAATLDKMIEVTSGTAAMSATDVGAMQVRIGNDTAAWADVSTNTNVESLIAYGATVYLKAKGSATQMASPEIKVKLPKRGNAPKATIDYAKGTVKLPKNAMYGLDNATITTSTGDSGATYYVGTTAIKGNGQDWGNKVIRLQTAANGAKPASKVFAVSVPAVEAATAWTAAASGVSFVTSGTSVLKNTGTKNLQYVVLDSDITATTDIAAIKWTALKPNASTKAFAATGKYVYVRIAGDKATQKLPSELKKVN